KIKNLKKKKKKKKKMNTTINNETIEPVFNRKSANWSVIMWWTLARNSSLLIQSFFKLNLNVNIDVIIIIIIVIIIVIIIIIIIVIVKRVEKFNPFSFLCLLVRFSSYNLNCCVVFVSYDDHHYFFFFLVLNHTEQLEQSRLHCA
ncbi:hypothetical protein RFI_04491, partial [Reticulomyxa filosa]